MSIEDRTKIDIIGTMSNSPVVQLIITDPLKWDDVSSHTIMLREKVDTYLEFIDSGQLELLSEPSMPENPEIHILLATKYMPHKDAQPIIETLRTSLAERGVIFDHEKR